MITRRKVIGGVVGAAVVGFIGIPEVVSATDLAQQQVRKINLKHTVSLIKRDLASTLNGFLFNPNDDTTRAEVVSGASDMFSKWVDHKIIEDYVVICDRSNNTPETIDRNKLIVDAAVKFPQRADFIHIHVEIGAVGYAGAINSV